MKPDFFSYWKVLRYVACALMAFWGFIMIFVHEDASRGKVLLMMAATGVFATLMFDMFDKHLRDKK